MIKDQTTEFKKKQQPLRDLVNSIQTNSKPTVKLSHVKAADKSNSDKKEDANNEDQEQEEDDSDKSEKEKSIKNSADNMANDAEKLTDLITKSM